MSDIQEYPDVVQEVRGALVSSFLVANVPLCCLWRKVHESFKVSTCCTLYSDMHTHTHKHTHTHTHTHTNLLFSSAFSHQIMVMTSRYWGGCFFFLGGGGGEERGKGWSTKILEEEADSLPVVILELFFSHKITRDAEIKISSSENPQQLKSRFLQVTLYLNQCWSKYTVVCISFAYRQKFSLSNGAKALVKFPGRHGLGAQY